MDEPLCRMSLVESCLSGEHIRNQLSLVHQDRAVDNQALDALPLLRRIPKVERPATVLFDPTMGVARVFCTDLI